MANRIQFVSSKGTLHQMYNILTMETGLCAQDSSRVGFSSLDIALKSISALISIISRMKV